MNALQFYKHQLKQVVNNPDLTPQERGRIANGISYFKDGKVETLFEKYKATAEFAEELAEKKRQWDIYENSSSLKKIYLYSKFKFSKLWRKFKKVLGE